MKINLEIPSDEHHKEYRSSAELYGMDNFDNIDAQDVNFCVASENTEKSFEVSVSRSVDCCGEKFGMGSAGADSVNSERLNYEPQNGLEFESKEAAYHFYREYAHLVGFGVTIKSSRRSKRSGKFIDVKVACSRFGSKRASNATLNTRCCPKTGCKAGMHIKRREDDKWFIYDFVEKHNHEICEDDFYSGLRGKFKPSDETMPQKKGLQLVLDDGDVRILLEHFMVMQDEAPGFFYALDLDNQTQLKNVFWVDAKARNDYRNFSDVVLFDTFYIKNKYNIPFAPFVGVNHHCQYILLGGALLGENSKSTFDWLMRTWQRAMGGQAPKIIVSDQDKLLSEVIGEVFPETRLFFCLWHVLSKILDCSIHSVIQANHQVERFRDCIHCSWTEEQFERRWWKMVGEFCLAEDEVFLSLYRDRRKWVPAFMKGTVLAGLSTSDRTESVASYFDHYMHPEATFKEFFTQYITFLRNRYETAAKDELPMQNRQPPLKPLSPFEKQISLIYTERAFRKFQSELLGVVCCQLHKEREDGGPILNLRVNDFENHEKFLVRWNEAQLDICCSCHSFEYKGFLCKHAILVLQNSDIPSVPSHYILNRWSKDAATSANTGLSAKLHNREERFNDLCKRALRLGELGSISQEAYDITLKVLEEAMETSVGINNSGSCQLEPNRLAAAGFCDTGKEDQINSVSLKKRKYKRLKVCPDPVGAINGVRERGNLVAQKLNNYYITELENEENLGSREGTLDGYYDCHQTTHGTDCNSSQTTIQVLGQLPSMRRHVGYHMTQHSIQEMGDIGSRSGPIQSLFAIGDNSQNMSMDSSQFHSTSSRHCSGTDKSIFVSMSNVISSSKMAPSYM